MVNRPNRLMLSAAALVSSVLFSTQVQAESAWQPLEIIDMTTAKTFSADVVVTTGFLDNMDFVSLDEPKLSVASDALKFNTDSPKKSGWAGLVEVEVKEEPTLAFDEISTFSDTLVSADSETKVQGFYTMRYQFNSTARFRPYAGAGLGLVATTSETEAGGVVAGRATAGFDLTLGKGSALFAEYAILKNGGVNLGSLADSDNATGAVPDVEHSVKLGFRRTF